MKELCKIFICLCFTFQAMSMQSMMREIGREALAEFKLQQRQEAEYARQQKVALAIKDQYQLREMIDSNDPVDVKIVYLTKVLQVSDIVLPTIDDKTSRLDRVEEKMNFGTFLQHVMIEVASEGDRIDLYMDKIVDHNENVETCRETCCCMPWFIESAATGFVKESKEQVEKKLETLKRQVASQKALEIIVVSNYIHDEDEQL